MRAVKAKQLRREAKVMSNQVETDYHDTVFQKPYRNPVTGQYSVYEVYTREMVGNSQRKVYKLLKKLEG